MCKYLIIYLSILRQTVPNICFLAPNLNYLFLDKQFQTITFCPYFSLKPYSPEVHTKTTFFFTHQPCYFRPTPHLTRSPSTRMKRQGFACCKPSPTRLKRDACEYARVYCRRNVGAVTVSLSFCCLVVRGC